MNLQVDVPNACLLLWEDSFQSSQAIRHKQLTSRGLGTKPAQNASCPGMSSTVRQLCSAGLVSFLREQTDDTMSDTGRNESLPHAATALLELSAQTSTPMSTFSSPALPQVNLGASGHFCFVAR